MNEDKKQVTFTVIYGEPFQNFQQRHFYVTKSSIDPQSRDDSNHTTIAGALRAATRCARDNKGTLTKTTVEEIADFKPKAVKPPLSKWAEERKKR